MIWIMFRIIAFLMILTELGFSQLMNNKNHYINQDNELIIITFGDTVLTKNQNLLIKYNEFNVSKNITAKKCLFEKEKFQIIESYFITNDLLIEVFSSTEDTIKYVKLVEEGDTTFFNKVFNEPTNSFAFINLLLIYTNIFETEEVALNLYPILPKSFKFIAKNEGVEEIEVRNKIYNCYHICVDAESIFASMIMPDCDIWFEKNSKIMIKMEISDNYLLIK